MRWGGRRVCGGYRSGVSTRISEVWLPPGRRWNWHWAFDIKSSGSGRADAPTHPRMEGLAQLREADEVAHVQQSEYLREHIVGE